MLSIVIFVLSFVVSSIQAAGYAQSNYYGAGGCSSNLIYSTVAKSDQASDKLLNQCFSDPSSSVGAFSTLVVSSDGSLNYTGFSGKVFIAETWANTTDCKNNKATNTIATVADTCYKVPSTSQTKYKKYSIKDNTVNLLDCSDSQCTSCTQTPVPLLNCQAIGPNAVTYRISDSQNPNSAGLASVNLIIVVVALLSQLLYLF